MRPVALCRSTTAIRAMSFAASDTSKISDLVRTVFEVTPITRALPFVGSSMVSSAAVGT